MANQNTRNDQYRAADIINVGHWAGFNLASIRQQFGVVLAQARIADELVNPFPPRPINLETAVRSCIDAYLTNWITCVFRCGFVPNRVPGDIKPLYKWSLAQRNGPRPSV
ncbi:hypothetical protein C8Q69DRAFT_336544 [Paecilomyces variotii]|uniref:Uncharacterized protein n=1 Tax=Byssochlamys spectabilis TaxID=264951 RepID=A0A443HPU4_BYSSP|nr:hypothetical protein C8Q69DRAFT_336544 [Paecilomyces variotii]RWQ93821.1 hypothetical protein C8Q69DRAFT_336544 [Paecilomyces variotii]